MALASLAAAALRSESHVAQPGLKMCVCVRKRPLNRKERNAYDIDVITIPDGETTLVGGWGRCRSVEDM